MAKKILIPIDFKIESLHTLRIALEKFEENKTDVILMYAENISDSIMDLLFYSPNKIIQNHCKPEFNEAISIIRNRFENIINSLKIELYHGNNLNAFNNFLNANQIDTIYIPKNYELKMTKNGFDPISIIHKSNHNVIEIEWMPESNVNHSNQLNVLFNK